MSVVVAFDRHPVAVYPDLEAAAEAVESLPCEADEHVTCYALPDSDSLGNLWHRHSKGGRAAGPAAGGAGLPVTLSIH